MDMLRSIGKQSVESVLKQTNCHVCLCVAAKGLDLYQVLAPNAYSYLEEFIPVIRKTVQSQVSDE